MKLIAIAFASLGLTEALSELLIYRPVIIPMQEQVLAIPLYWWGVLFMPVIVVSLLFGSLAGTYSRAILLAISGAVASHIFNVVAAILHFPGHGESWSLNAPLIYWSVGLAVQAVFYFIFMAIGLFAYKRYVITFKNT